MINETRVNLKHLLEDIRDSYASPLEEVIITELIANALDSGATKIEFKADPDAKFLRCTDNGQGMKREQIREYHNIAATAKQKGRGIGFAGVGAKLSLLLGEKVITESKGGRGSRVATEWQLLNPYRAPWKFVPSTDVVITPRGTAVAIYFKDQNIHLLSADFVRSAVIKHFYPLLHNGLTENILRFVYRKGVEFVVNGEIVVLSDSEQRADSIFAVGLGRRKKAIGAGFLTKRIQLQNWLQKLTGQKPAETPLPRGLSVSTFGKIIKSGWEWLGILPKNHETLCGVVEIPALSELLTTNKNDFLSDSASLKKYYKIRKAIQRAILPVLRSLGEYAESDKPPAHKNIKPLTRQIENALLNVTDDFPELLSLLGARRRAPASGGAATGSIDV
ncbi:MAG: ATP-binding protein, partial [Patescibacteria group bacterium]